MTTCYVIFAILVLFIALTVSTQTCPGWRAPRLGVDVFFRSGRS